MYTPKDFAGDTPPPRIMGTEMEYSLLSTGNDRTAVEKSIRRGVRLFGGRHEQEFLLNGARLYQDCSNVEYATPESLGPLQQACAEIAGQMIVGHAISTALDDQAVAYRRTGGVLASGELESLGFHQNFLTIPYADYDQQLHDATVFGSYLVTRTVWSGIGMLTDSGYVLSQKAHDIQGDTSGDAAKRIVTLGWLGSATQQRRKPLLSWSNVNFQGSMESHAKGWERLEVRFADAAHSPWVRYMTMATGSLMLRLLEHRHLFRSGVWDDVNLHTLPDRASIVSSDLSLEQPLRTVSGRAETALSIQTRLAEMSLELMDKVQLPNDEQEAAHEWIRICDDLTFYDHKHPETLKPLADRLDWAARLHQIHRRVADATDHRISRSNELAHAAELQWDRIVPHAYADTYWRKKRPDFYLQHDKTISDLISHPPRETRAFVRGLAIRVDMRVPRGHWGSIKDENDRLTQLPDPYDNRPR